MSGRDIAKLALLIFIVVFQVVDYLCQRYLAKLNSIRESLRPHKSQLLIYYSVRPESESAEIITPCDLQLIIDVDFRGRTMEVLRQGTQTDPEITRLIAGDNLDFKIYTDVHD